MSGMEDDAGPGPGGTARHGAPPGTTSEARTCCRKARGRPPHSRSSCPFFTGAHRRRGFGGEVVPAGPARPGHRRRADLGAGDGAVARDRGRLRHARGARLVRPLRRRAARGDRRRGHRHPRRPERAAAAHRPRPLPARARSGWCDAVRRGERRRDAALHPDHRFPRHPAAARRARRYLGRFLAITDAHREALAERLGDAG